MRDRLSFRRFCGIPLDEETPDHSSIWPFRQRIEKRGLSEAVQAEVNRQLDAREAIVKRGTLVDATIIAAAVKPPPHEEGQVNPRDPDAGFAKKNDETCFGYKARGEAMIQGDEKAYYADKAYDRRALRDKRPVECDPASRGAFVLISLIRLRGLGRNSSSQVNEINNLTSAASMAEEPAIPNPIVQAECKDRERATFDMIRRALKSMSSRVGLNYSRLRPSFLRST